MPALPVRTTAVVLALAFGQAYAAEPNIYQPVAPDEFVDGSQSLLDDVLYITRGTDAGGGQRNLPSQLSVVASATRNLMAPGDDEGELEKVGDLFDYVFLDSTDNKLVFGTRVILLPTVEGLQNDFEVNFMYRKGWAGYSTDAAWTQLSTSDLRLYSVARSRTDFDGISSDADLITFQSDINVTERNPRSGLFLIKTDAPNYRLAANAIEVYQAGEETQLPTRLFTDGFVAAPVPEPSTYALLLGGLGLLGAVARRRARK